MIERHIDFYVEDEDGIAARCICRRRSCGHLHAARRRSLADGGCDCHGAHRPGGWRAAGSAHGLDRERGIQFLIQDELRAVIPQPAACTPEAVETAMDVPLRRVAV